MRIIFSGSRDWFPFLGIQSTFIKLLYKYDTFTVIQGKAKGVDTIARNLAIMYGLPYVDYPADWSLGKAAGMIRNREMLQENPNLVIAFPRNEHSRGTMGMIKLAQLAKIPVWVYNETAVKEMYKQAGIDYEREQYKEIINYAGI